MTPRTAHTVHILSVFADIGDAIFRILPEITVVNVLTLISKILARTSKET